MRYAFFILCGFLAATQHVYAQVESRPEAALSSGGVFSLEIQPEREKALARYIDSLVLSERQQRALELQVIHQSPLTTFISEVSKYTPYRFKPEVDTFFLQNYMRRDFNPVEKDQLHLGLRRSTPRFSVRIGL